MNRLACIFVLIAATASLHAAPATALAFTPDGAILASGAHREVQLRSVPSGKITAGFPAEFSRISSLAFSSDGDYLALAGGTPGESGAASILSWDGKSIEHRFTNFTDLVTAAKFNHDAAWLAVASADASAFLFPLESSRREAIELRGHSGPVLDIAWSSKGNILVTASADRSLKVWSAADGELLRSFSQHTEPVHAVVFRPRSDPSDESPIQCASASDDGTVRIWQPTIGRMVRIIRGHDAPVFTVAYTPDGQKLFSAGKDGIVRRLDTDSDQILGEWKAHTEPIYHIAISPDGQHLATGDWSGKERLWRIVGDQLVGGQSGIEPRMDTNQHE